MSAMSTRSSSQKQQNKKKSKAAPKQKQPTLGDRMTKMEAAIDRVVVIQEAQLVNETSAPRGRKTTKKNPATTCKRRSVSLDLPIREQSPVNIIRDRDLLDFVHPVTTQDQARSADDVRPRDAYTRPQVRHDPVTASQPIDPNTNPAQSRHLDPHINVNNNTPWNVWLAKPDLPASASIGPPTSRPNYPMPRSSIDIAPDDVEAQVQQIIATTAHSLSKGNNKPEPYPFKYVARGPERRKLSINTVTLAEHLWGILRMVKDKKLDQNLVPFLLKHLEDVIEDACDFEWSRVRRWSEEIFSLVSESRLETGWASQNRIQMLRMNISRTESGALYQVKEFQASAPHQQREYNNKKQSQQTSFAQDPPRGGFPCTAYNSPAGCPLPPGHIQNGRKLAHICTFCLYNSSAAYTHPESQCRNKLRYLPPHF